MRFVETTPEAIGEEKPYTPTKWWLDTARPLKPEKDPHNQKFVAVQTEADKDPNNFVKHEKMFLLFNDQAEYYAVCEFCYRAHYNQQWSGSTRNSSWRENSERYLARHVQLKGWCQFCDPIFGNGGWI